jgi:hypothetical protein
MCSRCDFNLSLHDGFGCLKHRRFVQTLASVLAASGRCSIFRRIGAGAILEKEGVRVAV